MAVSPGRGGRGWGALVALGLAAMFWPGLNPLPLVGFPLGLVLLVLPPRGLPQRAVAVMALTLAGLGLNGDPLPLVNGLWPGLLAIWFVAAVFALPRSSFTTRAVAATAAGALTVAAVGLFRPDLPGAADAAILGLSREWAAQMVASQKAAGRPLPPGSLEVVDAFRAGWVLIAPALAALTSMAALALAWWVYRRLLQVEDRPLAPFREFRFPDELVWVAIAGIVLVVIPGLNADGQRVGINLLTFVGTLYGLRGLAVLTALARGGVGAGGILLAVAVAVLMGPEVVGAMALVALSAALLVGLTDTWLDLRARMARLGGPGNNGVKR